MKDAEAMTTSRPKLFELHLKKERRKIEAEGEASNKHSSLDLQLSSRMDCWILASNICEPVVDFERKDTSPFV